MRRFLRNAYSVLSFFVSNTGISQRVRRFGQPTANLRPTYGILGQRRPSRVADPLTDPQVISAICVTLSLTLARANSKHP